MRTTLTLRAKTAVGAAAAIAVLVPLGIGGARGQALRPVSLRAQSAPQPLPAFDAVSIRPFQRTRGVPWDSGAHYDPQRFSIQGTFIRELIEEAYQVTSNQIMGNPSAMVRGQFTIIGTTDHPATTAQMRLMLQRVLAERFQLVVEDTTQVQPVYDLVVVKGGPKLQAMHSEQECAAYNAEPDNNLIPRGAFYSYAGCTITDLVHRLNFPDPTTFGLVPLLPVLDKTGLTGLYRIALWQTVGPRMPVPGHPNMMRTTNIEPIQEALIQELGLDLVKSKGPYRMLTIKHIAAPDAN